MTSSPPDVPLAAVLRGVQEPRISCAPAYVATSGDEVADFAAVHGLILDPWQRTVLRMALGEQADGRWSAFEVGLMVPRQNGKGAILEARELGGLFLLGERLIIHTAHQFKTSAEAFLRIKHLIDSSDDLSKRVKRMYSSPADTGIDLVNGNRLKFIARAVNGSGRGFTGDVVIMDEAYRLPPEAMEALMPTLTARPNPQIWYTSSAGYADSVVLASLRKRGMEGGGSSLTYLEWSAPDDCDLDDHAAWAQANPALGYRITEEAILRNREAFSDNPVGFGREHLGLWEDAAGDPVIDLGLWMSLTDSESAPDDPYSVVFAVDMPPDRSSATIALAGERADGLRHVEIVDQRPGMKWVAPRLAELVQKWSPPAVIVDAGSPAGGLLLPELEELGVETVNPSTREVGQAAGLFYDSVTEGQLRHRGDPLLKAALEVAKKRMVGDSWLWDRRDLTDISPLVAATLALWGSAVHGQQPSPNIW